MDSNLMQLGCDQCIEQRSVEEEHADVVCTPTVGVYHTVAAARTAPHKYHSACAYIQRPVYRHAGHKAGPQNPLP